MNNTLDVKNAASGTDTATTDRRETVNRTGGASRIVSVARMHLVNRQTFIWVPLLVLGGSTLVSLAIFVALPSGGGPMYSGSSQAPLWYFFAIGMTTLTTTFPFSQAMSVSRRTFFLGTTLIVAVVSAIMATIYSVMALIERATDGYGFEGYIFDIPWIMADGIWKGWILIFIGTLLFFSIGFFFTVIWKRFGAVMLVGLLVGLALLLVGGAFILTQTSSWQAFGNWIAGLTPLAVSAGAGVAVLAMSFIGYGALRRATP